MFTQLSVVSAVALHVVGSAATYALAAPAAQGPIEVSGLLDSLRTWSLTVFSGIVAIVFIWKLIGHVKESPIDWKSVAGDLFAIAFMAAVAANSSTIMDYVRNNITFNAR
jgi:hypothetical protein